MLDCSSHKIVKPIPENLRYKVCLRSLNDLTGLSNTLSVSFDSLLSEKFKRDFFEELDRHWTEPIVIVRPNPFMFVVSDCIDGAQFSIEGEIERIDYQSLINIKESLLNWHFHINDFFALSQTASSDNNMVGIIQYRFSIFDSNNTKIDSFVTIGASGVDIGKIDKISRRQLLDEANTVAACQFTLDLYNHLEKKYSWNLPHRERKYRGEKVEKNIILCSPPKHE